MNKLFSERKRIEILSSFYDTEEGGNSMRLTSYYTHRFLIDKIEGNNVLLLGLGDGYIALNSFLKFNLFVIEGSQALIEKYKNTGPVIIHALFEEFHSKLKFDCILGTHILEHVDDPITLLRLTRSWLKPKGQAIFTVPNADSLHRRIGVELGMLKKRDGLGALDIAIGHRRIYTLQKLNNDLLKAGYEIEDMQGYFLKILSHKQIADWDRPLLDAIYKVSLSLPTEFCSNLAAFCRNTGLP